MLLGICVIILDVVRKLHIDSVLSQSYEMLTPSLPPCLQAFLSSVCEL